MSTPARIDTHAHFLPDFYREALTAAGHSQPDGMPAIPSWSESAHLSFMSDQGITKSYLSISTPGVHLQPGDDAAAAKLARQCNELAADLSRRHQGKFGSFASVPLPNIDLALAEITYVFDKLHADGITVLTNYHGVYLGDPCLEPVWAELNRRKAKVFLHPTTPCTCDATTGQVNRFKPMSYPNPMMEFFFDTTRAVVNLILTGTVDRHPDITFLIPHCGAALPPLIDRFSNFATRILANDDVKLSVENIRHIFRHRFYYDLAGFAMQNQIHGTLRWADPDRLLYGSDFPYTPPQGIKFQAEIMDEVAAELWNEEVTEKVYCGNAEALLG